MGSTARPNSRRSPRRARAHRLHPRPPGRGRTVPRSFHAKDVIETSPDGPAASVNVRHTLASVGGMCYSDWAEDIARTLLEEPLPRRWAHVQGVAHVART